MTNARFVMKSSTFMFYLYSYGASIIIYEYISFTTAELNKNCFSFPISYFPSVKIYRMILKLINIFLTEQSVKKHGLIRLLKECRTRHTCI